ncbi:DMT family transporter [Williamsia sp. M5A3_1d]
MPDRPLPPRLAAPTVLLYAAGYPIGSATVAVMSPFLVIALRFALSAGLLWVIVAIRRPVRPTGRQIGHAMVAGLMTQGIQFLGLYWALDHGVPSGLAALMIALNPVMTAGLMIVLLGHRESRRGVFALVLAAAAVVVACAPKILADHGIGLGIVAVIVAMIGLSAGGIYQGRFCTDMDVWLVSALGLTASTPVAAVFAATTPEHTTDLPRALILLATMIVFSSVGATTLYSACIKTSGARSASIVFAVIPAAASVMAWIALGESLSPLTIGGLALGAAACVAQATGDARLR